MKAHRLRDTFACSLLTAGVSLEHVSRLLGHSSIRMLSVPDTSELEKSYRSGDSLRPGEIRAAADIPMLKIVLTNVLLKVGDEAIKDGYKMAKAKSVRRLEEFRDRKNAGREVDCPIFCATG